ncbi:MAG: radical SAM protein [Bacteroidaceae bacterium]|nr:radical SAM protein [Bacteroidaceae bacterium]
MGRNGLSNLALCKISAYHKESGDIVEWAIPFTHYDILYRAKIFNFTKDDDRTFIADKTISGGTGYDLHSQLSQEIDDCQPDYSIYPYLPSDTAYGFLTRGCPNKCKWCVVPIKEGAIRPYWDIERVLNGKSKAVLMDNNILAAGDYCTEQLDKIIRIGCKVDFNQALDARLVTEENAKQLAQIRWIDRRIRFGCDTQAQISECERAIKMIADNGYKGEFFLYTMLHGTFEECFYRINYWRERNLELRRTKTGNMVYPYAQPYRDPHGINTIPYWQKCLSRWCNVKACFESVSFQEYRGKGFK